MHAGALFAIYLIIREGFHIPEPLNIWSFAGGVVGLLSAFALGVWVLGTVFPNHYMKGQPLRYDGVFGGLALSFVGGTGFFVLIAMSLPAFSLGMWTLFYVLYWVNIFGITVGYHRLPTHRAFKCGALFARILLGMGATARQKGVRWWGPTHLIHHARTEIEMQDPHTPHEGFLHAHIGWIWHSYVYPDTIWNLKEFSGVLEDNPLVREQERYCDAIMVLGFALPFFIFGPWAMWSGGEFQFWHGITEGAKAFLLAGLLRFVCSYHITLFVNSWAHKWGPRTFKGRNTGDSTDAWIVALFSGGETLQNIHHLMDSIACYWVKGYYFDFSGALLVALERLGRISWLKWAGLPYDLKTIGPAQIRFMKASATNAFAPPVR